MLSRTTALPRSRIGRFFLPVAFSRSVQSIHCRGAQMVDNDPTAKSMLTFQHITPYTRAIRAVYTSAMQTSRLKAAIPKVDAVLEGLIDVIEERRRDGSVDLQELCVKLTLDAIGTVALDTNLGGLDGSRHLQEAMIDVGHVMSRTAADPLKRMYYKLFPNSEGARHRRATIDRLSDEWKKLVAAVMEKEDPVDGDEPMWYALKNTIDPDTGAPLTDREMISEIGTIIMAGMHTTGHQLAWTLAYLAAHDHVTDKLLAELRENGLCGSPSVDVDFELLGKLSYLNAVIKEGMRIAHVIMVHINRVVVEDMAIMGYRIPKGTFLCVPGNRWIGADEDWEDHEAFRPERWLSGEDVSKKRYFPFLYGPRDCAGQKLAMLEMRMAIIRLVTRYRFGLKKPIGELTNKTRSGISTEAIGGIWMDVVPRAVAT